MTVFAHVPLMTALFVALGIVCPWYMGVMVFYGISGFIIFHTTEGSNFRDTPAFYVRRLMRIMPVMLLSLAAALVLSWMLSHNPMVDQFYPPMDDMKNVALGHALLIGDLPIIPAPSPLSTAGLWSISVEAHFYLLFGLLMALGLKGRVIGLTVCIAAMQAFKIWRASQGDNLFVQHAFYWELLYAGAIGCALRKHIKANGWLAAASFAYVLAFPYLTENAQGFGGVSRFFTAYAVLIVAIPYLVVSIAHGVSIVPRGWLDKFLYGTGEISYVVYVWHFQVIATAGLSAQAIGIPNMYASWVSMAVALVVSIPFFQALHKYVERPGIDLGRAIVRRLAASRRNERAAAIAPPSPI